MIRFYFDVVAIVFGLAGDASAVVLHMLRRLSQPEFRQRLAAAWNGLTRPPPTCKSNRHDELLSLIPFLAGACRPSQVHDGDHPFRRVAPNDDFDWTQVPDITGAINIAFRNVEFGS